MAKGCVMVPHTSPESEERLFLRDLPKPEEQPFHKSAGSLLKALCVQQQRGTDSLDHG